MSTKDDIRFSVNTILPRVVSVGIGFPLIVATEKVLAYTRFNISRNLDAVLAEFDADSVTYKMAKAIFDQPEHVGMIAIVGLDYTLTTVAEVANEALTTSDNTTYSAANGNFVEETLKDLTVNGSPANVEDLASIDYTAGTITFGSAQTGAVTMSYSHYTIAGTIANVVNVLQSLVDSQTDNDWFGLLTPFWTKEEVKPIIDFVNAQLTERNLKFALFDSPQISLHGDTELNSLQAAIYSHDEILPNLSAGLMGYAFSQVVGSFTYKDITVAGVNPSGYNRTQLDKIDSLEGQTYMIKGAYNVTTEGKVTNKARFIDSRQGQNYIQRQGIAALQKLVTENGKVPPTALGDNMITNVLTGVLEPLTETDTTVGLIKRTGSKSEYNVDLSERTYDPETRNISGIVIFYKEAGAGHTFDVTLNTEL